MRGFEIAAIMIGVFFAIGIAVGMLLVVALPLHRAMFRHRGNRRGYMSGGDWRPPPRSDDDDARPPRWPGG